MIDTRWRNRFEALIDELEAHPSIRVHQRILGSPASADELASAEAALGRRLPDEMRTFYAQVNGAHIEWSHCDPRWSYYGAMGSVNLFKLKSLSVRAEDHHIAVDYSCETSFLGLSHRNFLVWVDDPTGDARRFRKKFDVYLDALLEARAWSHWQLMFLYSSRYQQTVEEGQGRLQAVLPVLFPDFDVTRVGKASLCPPTDISSLLEGPRLFLYRLADLPTAFTSHLSSSSPLWDKLFFVMASEESIFSELFRAVPEPELDVTYEGLRLASLVGTAVTRTFCSSDLLVPSHVQTGGRQTLTVRSGFHTGNSEAVARWIHQRGCNPIPIRSWLEKVSFVKVCSVQDEWLQELQVRSNIVNIYQRELLPHVGEGLFVIDHTDNMYESFSLFHHPEGLKFTGILAGPGEQWIDLSLDDLKTGELNEFTLLGDIAESAPQTESKDLAKTWIAIARLSDLPAAITGALSAESPLWSRLFWVAPAQSPLIDAMQKALKTQRLTGISAAFRICDRLEQATEGFSGPKSHPATTEIYSGFHTAEGDQVEAWLGATGCRILDLSELLV